MKYLIHNLDDLNRFADLFLEKYLSAYKKVLFFGEMGVGKTTFIKLICEKLGATGNSSSPTFSIVNNYPIKNSPCSINHADLYRLKDSEELFGTGLLEHLYDDDYFFVEWPEIIEAYCEKNYLKVSIESNEDSSRTYILLTC
jgi:tRNA threonylcarbamoyladenosine biosynthesis protein TsaE